MLPASLSLNQLAERTRLSRQMLSFVESGRRVPTIDTAAWKFLRNPLLKCLVSMKVTFTLAVLAVLLLGAPSPCFALMGIADVSKERAKELGLEIRAEAHGPDQVWVGLEFKTGGELKEYERTELRIMEGGKFLVSASLKEDRSKPSRVSVTLTTDRSLLDKTSLVIVAGDPGDYTGYEVRLKDFLAADLLAKGQTAATAPDAAKPAFGPVRERVLPSGVPCRELFFQFRSGEIFIDGNGPGTSSEEAAYDHKRIEDAGGVDMSAGSTEEAVHIVGRGCFFTRDVNELEWERFTAGQVVEAMTYVNFVEGVVSPKKRELPITYLFKTTRGEMGIMEVLGTVEEKHDGWTERGMKFRYKLVQGTGTPPPAAVAAKSSLVFGQETKGLRAAHKVTPGEPFKLQIHLRNVSDHAISIEGAHFRQEDECLLADAQGQPVPITKVTHQISIGMHSGYFSPRQVAVFESAGLSFQSIDKVPSSAGYVAQAKPGRYTLRVRLRLPGGDVPFAPKTNAWQGVLETGPVTIEVKDPATQPVAPVADGVLSSVLGPAIERTVNDLLTTHENCALSLDTGKLLPVRAHITLGTLTNPPTEDAAVAWAKSNQVDAIAFVTIQAGKVVKCGLLCPGLVVCRAENPQWDPNTADPGMLKEDCEKAMHEWNFIPQIADVTTAGDFPVNYLILDTYTHRRGVLQILGVSDQPRGVKIRYRLVEGAAVKKAEPASTTGH